MNDEFKLIVAGGRDFSDKELCREKIHELKHILSNYKLSIVSGMARGADRLAWEIAKEDGIQVYEYYADWDSYGPSAGYRRNEVMARNSNGLLAFLHINPSKGTSHMIKTMQGLGKPVRIIRYGE
jgi:GH18 family chitinase